MNVTIEHTPEREELVRAMGSKDRSVSLAAQEVMAAFIGPVVEEVLMQKASSAEIYRTDVVDGDDSPSYPLDLFYDEGVDHVQVWSQNIAGGLPSSQISGMEELKVMTYSLDSAVHCLRRYAERNRLSVIAKMIEKMAQEILVKQEVNAWGVLLKALAEATTNGNLHTVNTETESVLRVDDFSSVLTRIARINESFVTDGTPANFNNAGVTDMYMGPEAMAQVRRFAYNPMNTIEASTSDPTVGQVALPDNVREQIFRSAGMAEIFGIMLHQLNEFGVGRTYNTIFDTYSTSASQGHGGAFAGASDEIIVGVDKTRDAFIRPVFRQAEGGGTVAAAPDDQWSARSKKIGFWTELEEGRVVLDKRALVGIVV